MKSSRALLAFVFVAVLGAGVGVATAQVSGDFGTPPKLVPYSGFLEENGAPVSGAVDLSFFIVTSPETGIDGAIWQEDHPAVVVSGGSFSVLLGHSSAFGTLFADAGELYVGVSIDGVDLAGRQRIASAPYGISAGEARDFTVRGVLDAEGDVNVAGTTTLNGALNLPDDDFAAPANVHGTCTTVPVAVPFARELDDVVGALPTTCGGGQFMAGIFTQHHVNNAAVFRDRWVTHIVCCQL